MSQGAHWVQKKTLDFLELKLQVGVSIMSDCGARNQTIEVLNKGKKWS